MNNFKVIVIIEWSFFSYVKTIEVSNWLTSSYCLNIVNHRNLIAIKINYCYNNIVLGRMLLLWLYIVFVTLNN